MVPAAAQREDHHGGRPTHQLGFILSATVLAAVLATAGWTPSFLLAAAISVLAAGVVLALLRDAPHGRRPRVALGRALAVAGRDLREAWAEPGTRLAFWLGFLCLFAPMMFGVMWGYPFLVSGQGLSQELAAVLMAVLALSGLGYGVTIGTVMERYPYYRSRIGMGQPRPAPRSAAASSATSPGSTAPSNVPTTP